MFLNADSVLTSTQLLPQEERPDPELTPSLTDIINVDFVLDSLAYVVSPQVTYTSDLTTSIWHSMASVWLATPIPLTPPMDMTLPRLSLKKISFNRPMDQIAMANVRQEEIMLSPLCGVGAGQHHTQLCGGNHLRLPGGILL